jgi:hypothetical protein
MAAFVRFTDGFLGSVTQRTRRAPREGAHLAERVRLLEAERDAVAGRRRGAGGEDLAELTERWKALEAQLASASPSASVEEAARRARLDATVANLTSSGAVEAYLGLLEAARGARRPEPARHAPHAAPAPRAHRPPRAARGPAGARAARARAGPRARGRARPRALGRADRARPQRGQPGRAPEVDGTSSTARRAELEASLARLEREDREAVAARRGAHLVQRGAHRDARAAPPPRERVPVGRGPDRRRRPPAERALAPRGTDHRRSCSSSSPPAPASASPRAGTR